MALMKDERTLWLTQSAVIAALYAVFTLILPVNAAGTVEFRISEALTMIAALTPAAVPGLTIGCVLANILHGAALLDVIFGSLATLLAAAATYLTRKNIWVAAVWPAVFNGLIVGLLLKYVYQMEMSLPLLMLSVAAGELVICYVLGIPLVKLLEKTSLFRKEKKGSR